MLFKVICNEDTVKWLIPKHSPVLMSLCKNFDRLNKTEKQRTSYLKVGDLILVCCSVI